MKKIAIITPFLANGGLEKVAVVGAEELMKYYDVTLIVMDTFHIDYPYDGNMIDLHVSLMDRGVFRRLYNIVKSTLKLRRLKKENCFDVVISHGELANLPNVFSGGRHNILTVHENRLAALKDLQGKLVNKIIKYIYSARSVTKVVTVSEGIRESFIDNLGISEDVIMTIHNPYNIDEIKMLAAEEMGSLTTLFAGPVLVTTGRLSMQKGQWFLLRIFKEQKKRIPDIKLVILGNGEIKDRLISLSEELGLKTYSNWSGARLDDSCDVYFLGFQKNPFKFIRHAKLFMMTSLWEGFGNTIVEAMACGTPVISTDCKSGPGEIIYPEPDKKNELDEPCYEGQGVLMPVFQNKFVGASEPLSEREKLWVDTLYGLLNDENKLRHYASAGPKRADDFRLEKIMQEWKNLIDSVLQNDERHVCDA